MNEFLISMPCKGRCFHLPPGSISFRSTNNKVFVDGQPLVLQFKNPISEDNLMIIYCKFEPFGVPYLCISAKQKTYFKEILVNDYNIIMDQSFGQCFDARDKASEFSYFLVQSK